MLPHHHAGNISSKHNANAITKLWSVLPDPAQTKFMQPNLLSLNPKAEYTTAWRTGVEEARSAARIPSCRQVLLLLWIATFVLQAFAASLRTYVNPDGVSYLHLSNYLFEGNLEKGMAEYGVNTFLCLLTLFKRLGLDPFYAGVWWNVVVSSIVVLPLFGWVRRMFDGRIAVIASLLYAIHPIVLSIGSALMRDPMFWLFFHAILYSTWRGITEVRLRWFLLAGCCLTLAVHTRSEAWFLVIPILLWVLGRFCFVPGYRIRLCLGTILLLAIVPGSITLMNLTVLKSCPQWGIFRPSHLKQLTLLYDKIKEKFEGEEATAQKEVNPADSKKTASPKPHKKTKSSSADNSHSIFVALRRAVVRLAKSCSYLYVAYFLIGTIAWRAWRYFAFNAMFLMAVPIFGLIWYKSYSSDISPRYFLPIVWVSLPVIAIGVLAIVQKIASFSKKRDGVPEPDLSTAEKDDSHAGEATPVQKPSLKKSLYWLVVVMAFTFTVNCFGAIWGTSISEQKECELGKWIRKQFGPNQTICCINRKSRMAAWYAETPRHFWRDFPVFGSNKSIVPEKVLAATFKKSKPRVVLCWENHRIAPDEVGLFETLEKNNYYGYQVVEPDVLSEYEPRVLVLVRKDAL